MLAKRMQSEPKFCAALCYLQLDPFPPFDPGKNGPLYLIKEKQVYANQYIYIYIIL